MKITVPGELTVDSTQFATLVPVKAEDMKAVNDFETKLPKLTEDGRPLFRSNLKALRIVDGAVASEEQDLNLTIITPVDLRPGVLYGLSGVATISHYKNRETGRMCVSITAETVKPVDQINKINVADLAGKLSAPASKPHQN